MANAIVKNLSFGNKAKDKIFKGIEKLTNAVSSTLGASGKCVIMEDQEGNPIITKDGVTVANSIILQDSIENQMYKTIRSNLPKKEAQDLVDLFDAQRMVYDTANKQVIKDMAKQEPEGVINYLLSTGSKNKPLVNTKANDFMNFLKETGSVPEIRGIQNGLINHIRKNFLDPSSRVHLEKLFPPSLQSLVALKQPVFLSTTSLKSPKTPL